MPSKPSKFARLTAAMEVDGVFLTADPDGEVRLRAHLGDEAGLARWDVPAVRTYIDRHQAELWKWLRSPLDDLPEADRHSLYGTLGAASRTGASE